MNDAMSACDPLAEGRSLGVVDLAMNSGDGTALVIGGSGMLADATNWLVNRSQCTLLVSRSASKTVAVMKNVQALDVDWHGSLFKQRLKDALSPLQPLSQALLWLHDPEPTLHWLAPLLTTARTVVVLGSMDGRPALPASTTMLTFVQLGAVATDSGRRWLTHAEISEAAIAALLDGQSSVIGELRPAN